MQFHRLDDDFSHHGIPVIAMKNTDGALRRINFSMRNDIRIGKKRPVVIAGLREPAATARGGLTLRRS